MAQFQIQNEDDVIIVEFAPVAGLKPVSLPSPAEIAGKSKEAIDDALKTIRKIARKKVKTIGEIPIVKSPNIIAVSFSLKLSAEDEIKDGFVLAELR